MLFFQEIVEELSPEQVGKFEQFYEELIEYNQKVNLTAIVDKEEVYLKHFFDSLLIRKDRYLLDSETICDLGSGGGFPGIPLAIYFPNKKFYLVEPTGKRCTFLNLVIKKLELANVEVINSRIEEVEMKYDFLVTRAVAKINIIMELASQNIKINGYLCLLKAKSGPEEMIESANAQKILNYQFVEDIAIELPNNAGERHNIYFKKLQETSSKYPRNFGQIKKKPL